MKTLLLTIFIFAGIASSLSAAILGGPLTNGANGHVYFLLTTNTWLAAETEAVSLGGHLASLNGPAEDLWVYTNFASFGGSARTLSIGLTDAEIEGTFHWINGDESAYRNWGSGEPNNANGSEDYGAIFPPGNNRAGHWNDYPYDAGLYNGVVEVIPGRASSLTVDVAAEITWTTQTTNT